MLFLFATCGIIQATFLPGFLLTSYFIKEKNPLRFLAFSFALSLCVSYALTFTLVALGFFTQTVLFSLFILQCFLLIPLIKPYTFPTHIQFCSEQTTQNYKIILYFIALISLLRSLNYIFRTAGDSLGGWDAIVSWNRWALDLYSGSFPSHTWLYPQLVPSINATIYTMAGQELQIFASFAQSLYILFAQFAIFSFLKSKNAVAFLLTGIFLYSFCGFMNVGDADIPVMCMVIFSATALLSWIQNKKPTYFILAFTLACFACVTKQAGLVWLAFCIIIAYTSHKDAFLQIFRTKTIYFILFITCITLFWYISILYLTFFENYSIEVSYVMGTIHGDKSYIDRFLNAVTLNYELFFGFLCTFPLLFFKEYRYWALMGIVYYLVWACLLSYDARNASVSIPFLAFSISIILQFILQKMATMLHRQKLSAFCTKFAFYHPRRYVYVVGLIILSIFTYKAFSDGAYAGKSFSTANLIEKDRTQRQNHGSKELNAAQSAAMEKYDVPLLTSYQIGLFLPNIKKGSYIGYLNANTIKKGSYIGYLNANTIKNAIQQNETFLLIGTSEELKHFENILSSYTAKILFKEKTFSLVLYSMKRHIN